MNIFKNFFNSFKRQPDCTTNKTKEKLDIFPYCNSLYQTVANSSMQEQYSYVVKNADVQSALEQKKSYIFNKGWDITTVDGNLSNEDMRVIEEIKAYFTRKNQQDKNLIGCIKNVIVQRYGLGIGYIQRTPNEGTNGQGSFFYDDLQPGSVSWNVDKQGRFLDIPYYYVNSYDSKQPLPKGSIIKIAGDTTNLSFYNSDYRALLPVSPIFSMLFLLIASDFVDMFEAGVFKNGILPGAVLETPEGTSINSPEMKEIFDFLMHKHSYNGGQSGAFKYEIKSTRTGEDVEIKVPFGAPLPLPGGFKLTSGLNPADFSKPELKKYTTSKIFGALKFPVELIPGMERGSSLGSGKSQEEALNNYEQTENNPNKKEISDTITEQILKDNDRIYKETKGKFGIKLLSNGSTDLSRFKFVLPEVPNKIGMEVIAQFNNSIANGVKFTQREARSFFLPYMPINDTKLIEDELDEVITKPEQPQQEQQTPFQFKTSNQIYKAKEKPMKIYNENARGYNSLDKQIKSLENQTNIGLEKVITTIIEKYMRDVKNNAYNEADENYDLRKVAKIKLKDLNKLRMLLSKQTDKAWQEGEAQQLNDPNVIGKIEKQKQLKYNHNYDVVEIIDNEIIIKADENTMAGAWDYSQLEETIVMISETQTNKIAGRLIADLQEAVTKAIKQNIPVEDLVASIMQSETYSKILNYAYTEARTALGEARQQSRFKAINDIGAEYFQIDATLDDRTTEICQKMNGIIIKADELNEFPPGLPPYHYNCRTEINAIYEEDLTDAIRDLGTEAGEKFDNEQYIQDTSKLIPTGFEG